MTLAIVRATCPDCGRDGPCVREDLDTEVTITCTCEYVWADE